MLLFLLYFFSICVVASSACIPLSQVILLMLHAASWQQKIHPWIGLNLFWECDVTISSDQLLLRGTALGVRRQGKETKEHVCESADNWGGRGGGDSSYHRLGGLPRRPCQYSCQRVSELAYVPTCLHTITCLLVLWEVENTITNSYRDNCNRYVYYPMGRGRPSWTLLPMCLSNNHKLISRASRLSHTVTAASTLQRAPFHSETV